MAFELTAFAKLESLSLASEGGAREGTVGFFGDFVREIIYLKKTQISFILLYKVNNKTIIAQ